MAQSGRADGAAAFLAHPELVIPKTPFIVPYRLQ